MEERIISREDFYTALEKMREMHTTMTEICQALGIDDFGESAIGRLFDQGFDVFTTLIFGTNYIDECIYDALLEDEIHFLMEPDEGFNKDDSNGIPCTITYDQYYDYFVLRYFDYPEC